MANNFAEIQSNWQYVLPPSRPSACEIERIGSLLLPIDRKKPIAVLGSTIEFRNLLHAMGFHNVVIFEKNKSFYDWTLSWITHGIEYEYVVWGDWLETIKHYDNYFCAILSDLTMGNVSYDNRESFYYDIYNAVEEGGFFVDKVLTHCVPHIPLEELIVKYERIPINLEMINRFSCEVLFCSTLLNNGIIDTSKFYSILNKRCDSPIIRKYIEKAHVITPENCIWYYGIMWNELEAQYLRGYSKCVVYEDVLDSPYHGRCRQYIHTK